MFKTRSDYLKTSSKENDSNLQHYLCGNLAGHKPFLVATFSVRVAEGQFDIHSALVADFNSASEWLFNKGTNKLETLQLMRPNDDLPQGWQLHDIVLIRTVPEAVGICDEYVTAEGKYFRFYKGTLRESDKHSSAITTRYSKLDKLVLHQAKE